MHIQQDWAVFLHTLSWIYRSLGESQAFYDSVRRAVFRGAEYRWADSRYCETTISWSAMTALPGIIHNIRSIFFAVIQHIGTNAVGDPKFYTPNFNSTAHLHRNPENTGRSSGCQRSTDWASHLVRIGAWIDPQLRAYTCIFVAARVSSGKMIAIAMFPESRFLDQLEAHCKRWKRDIMRRFF